MPFNTKPTSLHDELIKLIPLEESHFDRLFEVASNPLVWEQHPNPNRYQLQDFTTYFKGAIASKGAFLIQESISEKTVGCSRYYDYNEADSSVLIGYTFIGIQYWGKGYNQKVKKIMLDYAFQFVDKVYFHIGAYNFRSQKAIEKIGAVKIDAFEVEYYGEPSKLNFVYVINKS